MSRAYSMQVRIYDCPPELYTAVKARANEEWDFEEWDFGDWDIDGDSDEVVLWGAGESQLCGGESEAEFVDRLMEALWSVCPRVRVVVDATFLEDLPRTTHTRSPK